LNPIWFILYRLYRVISGLRYWVTRRFAPPGLAVLAGVILSAMFGLDTENTVGYQAFTLLASLLAVAVCFGWFFRMRFAANRLLPRFGTVGLPLRYSVLVRNLTAKTQRGLTLLETLADTRPSFREWRAAQIADEKLARSFRVSERRRSNPFKVATVKNAAVPPLPPNQDAEVRLEILPLRRGALRFTGLTLARTDPFGLFRAFRRAPAPQTVLVLPKRYVVSPLALPGAMKYQDGGVALASNVGQSDEFVALRDYRRGDPLRHIHWRSWAKTGKPVVREFEDEFFVRHALVLDTFTDQPHSEIFEEAVSVAASFACTLPAQESLLDLLFVGSQAFCFTSGRGLAHADQMLEILASVQACPDRPFRELEHLVLGHIGAVSGCICVLLAWDEPRRNFIEKIKLLGVPLFVFLIVPPGSVAPEPGPLRDTPGSFKVLETGRIEQALASLKT